MPTCEERWESMTAQQMFLAVRGRMSYIQLGGGAHFPSYIWGDTCPVELVDFLSL